MNAKLVLHQLKKKLQTDGHITMADVEEAREAVKVFYSIENM